MASLAPPLDPPLTIKEVLQSEVVVSRRTGGRANINRVEMVHFAIDWFHEEQLQKRYELPVMGGVSGL